MNAAELFKLDGRKALVTGAGRGIRRVLSISLAQSGCDISILEKNISDARNVVEEIKKLQFRHFDKYKINIVFVSEF
jgi:NAD(P)-dependent dehydrogenase (short-subunit alcohol dehydrogenase family)